MSYLWWQLPGPRSFVSRVVADLRDGKNLVLCLPEHFTLGLQRAVRSEWGDDEWPWHTLDIGEEEDARPENVLFARFVPDAPADVIRSAHTLTKERSFAGNVIWLEGVTSRSWAAWKEFLVGYQHVCQAVSAFDRTLFCVPLIGELALNPPGEDVCLAQHHWYGTVDSIDIWLFSASLFAGNAMPTLHKRVAAAVAAHLSLWDPEVGERMAGEKIEAILNPVPLLRELARERGWQTDTKAEWHCGAANHFDGEERIHSAILASGNNGDMADEVARRIWSAEVGVLLPFVEEQRRQLIARLKHILRMPHVTRFNEIIEDVRDLEIGHIEYQVNSLAAVDADTRRLVWRLREIRNCLSHLEVLPPVLLLSEEILRVAK